MPSVDSNIPSSVAIVVPCYNEAGRLPLDTFREFIQIRPSVTFLLVNDGSTDDTLSVLKSLEEQGVSRVHVIDLQPNRGKAEAVRTGMVAAFSHGFGYAGYWDADLATPLDEIDRFIQLLDELPEVKIVFGSRVKLLGRSIERNPVRHYLGRIFATVASTVLALPVYDTQCGAKLFRNEPHIAALFAEPFRSGWIFDVEIIARLICASRKSNGLVPEKVIYELPLNRWRDVAGSRVKPGDFFKALIEIAGVYWHYLRAKSP